MIKNIILFVLVAVIASFVGWQYYDQFGLTLNHSGDQADRAASWGSFGDYIGGVLNPLIAGVGLVFFIITLKQNEKALKMSAEELKLTRKELKEAGAAQKELAIIERENLDERRLLRDYESCQKAEARIQERIDKILSHKVAISWQMPGASGDEFTLGDLIYSHYDQVIFYDDTTQVAIARLHEPVERFILQLDILYQLFERQNQLSTQLDIVYSSKLKTDVERFNKRIFMMRAEFVHEPDSDFDLKDSPFFKRLLANYEQFMEDNSEVLT